MMEAVQISETYISLHDAAAQYTAIFKVVSLFELLQETELCLKPNTDEVLFSVAVFFEFLRFPNSPVYC
jgi:hypothetical protein